MADTRFLTEPEKEREVVGFWEYRRDEENFRTAHPDAHGGEGWIDPEVLPLVDVLNALDGVCTVQSCCGHRWAVEDGADRVERVHVGQLWLRLSEHVTRGFEERVGILLATPVIEHVQKLYSYRGGRDPHEIVDVQFQPGAVDGAIAALVPFFGQIAGWDG